VKAKSNRLNAQMLAANIENLFVALNVKIEIMSSNEEEVEKSCCVN